LRTDLLRTRLLTVGLLVLAAGCASARPHPAPTVAPRVALADVLAAVRTAPALRSVPADLTPRLATAADDLGFDNGKCEAAPAADRVDACTFGDPASSTRVVLYGDSHAGMWLPAMIRIADERHWQLRLYGKPACPTPRLTFYNQQQSRPFDECDRFRDFVVGRIRAERPQLVVVTNESFSQKLDRGVLVTPAQWRAGLTRTLTTLQATGARVVVLGDTPVLDQSAPECLAAHTRNITACFTTRVAATRRVWNGADQAAAASTGSGYVSVLPWLCTAVCTPVIGNVTVYRNRFHLTATYARMLSGVLEDALLKTFPADTAP
jgi:SGNH domain-containing protein